MKSGFINIVPVLPSADIRRDVAWYQEKLGFSEYFADKMYAVLFREDLVIHLQWHADTQEDPLLGGSVIRIRVESINPIFEELLSRGTIDETALKPNTPWRTNEFGFYDLNNNAIFFTEDIRELI